MTDPIPYKAIGTRVYRGVVIGWASQEHDAAAFARELNALQSENARLRADAEAKRVEWDECEALLVERNNTFIMVNEALNRDVVELRAKVDRLEAVERAAREVAEAWDADNGSGVLTDDIDDLVGDLNAALEATDGE